MTRSVSSSRRRSIGNTRLMSRRASVLSYAWCEMARSDCCAPFGMMRKVGSPLRLNGRSLLRCTPPLETSATVLCASGLRSGVQGISPVASRLSCGSAMSLLTQWPNAVPTGMTPNRTALPPAFISLILMSASSELDHAAVDHQLRPHDERGFAGGEVQDDGGAARQKRKRLLDGEEGALEVGRHGFVEKRFGHVLQGDELADAGVDEQDVDPAESLLDPVHRLRDLRDLREVGLEHQDIGPELPLRRLHGSVAPSRDVHRGPLSGERP